MNFFNVDAETWDLTPCTWNTDIWHTDIFHTLTHLPFHPFTFLLLSPACLQVGWGFSGSFEGGGRGEGACGEGEGGDGGGETTARGGGEGDGAGYEVNEGPGKQPSEEVSGTYYIYVKWFIRWRIMCTIHTPLQHWHFINLFRLTSI